MASDKTYWRIQAVGWLALWGLALAAPNDSDTYKAMTAFGAGLALYTITN